MSRIDAVFEHEDGYKYNLVYSTASKFLTSINRLRKATFLHAVDYGRCITIYPSNLPDYRRMVKE